MAIWKLIFLAATASVFPQTVLSALTVVPRNTVAKERDLVYLNCSTNLDSKQVIWHHGTNFVYAAGSFHAPYKGRFELHQDSPGAHDLVIPSVDSSDAGSYSCEDDEGFGQRASAHLIILENDPICASNVALNEVIGPNSCGIEPDEVKLTCNTTYHGNIPPHMIWRKAGENIAITEGVTTVTDGTNVTQSLIFKANDLRNDRSSFICQTTQAADAQFACSTPQIKIQYAFGNFTRVSKSLDDTEIVCVANTSQNCTYRWLRDQNVTQVSNSDVLRPENPGNYRCEADCQMSHASCTIVSKIVEISAETDAPIQSTPSSLLVIVVVVVVTVAVLLIVLLIVILYVKYKHRKPKSDGQYSTEKEHNAECQSLTSTGVKNTEEKEEGSDQQQQIKNVIRKWTVSKGAEIRGVAAGDDRIYVLTYNRIYLEIYNMDSFDVIGRSSFEATLTQPRDMACCKLCKSLYVIDGTRKGESNRLVVINHDGNVIKHLEMYSDFSSLSVSTDCKVILTAPSIIEEYDSDGTLSRTLKIVQPEQLLVSAIKIDHHKFLVTRVAKDDGIHEVCLIEVDECGQEFRIKSIEKSHTLKKVSKRDEVNNTGILALAQNNEVFVLDGNNNCVLNLSADLSFQREFQLAEYGLQSPVKLNLIDSKNQLIVAGKFAQETGILILSLS